MKTEVATLLIVDDYPENVQVLDEILREDYRILAALNGPDALRLTSTEKPDLILLDIMMPGMDGFAVLEELKSRPRTGRIPVIFLTARDNAEDVVHAFQAGAADYVVKPFRREELLARIGNQLELRSNRRELEATLDILKMQLEFAREKQQRLLPQSLESIEGLDVAVQYVPYSEIGGDFYDISQIKPGIVRICLADAEGHGVAAALVAIAIKAEYESLRTMLQGPEEVLTFLNSSFLRKFPALRTHFTCIVADIDLHRNRLSFASAGHPAQALLAASGGLSLLRSSSFPIALFPEASYTAEEVEFNPGDRLVLFSDGVFEQFDASGDLFGEERLRAEMQNYDTAPSVAALANAIVERVRDFAFKGLEDDLTLCVVDRKGVVHV